jgi:pyridoxal phosphate-dependent aminotransferase EpsN
LSTLTIDSSKLNVTVNDIVEYLAQFNIEARPVWKPMHMQPLFGGNEYFAEGNDNAKFLFENGLCLPSDTKMTEEEQNLVIDKLKELIQKENLSFHK